MFYFFFSIPEILPGVPAAAIPNPEPAAVDGTVVNPGMESRNHTDPLHRI